MVLQSLFELTKPTPEKKETLVQLLQELQQEKFLHYG